MTKHVVTSPIISHKLAATTISLAAFLLFLVQPLLAKIILLRFGGSSNVWLTCLVLYQTLLLLGYAFACWITQAKRLGIILYLFALLASLAFLPILPGDFLKHVLIEKPTLAVIVLILTTVGFPYVVLASTSPVIQAWLTPLQGTKTYHLYALSNAASLLGLLAYPFGFELFLNTHQQVLVWSLGYGFYVVGIFLLFLCTRKWQLQSTSSFQELVHATTWKEWIPWLTWPALGSYILFSSTAALNQDVAGAPLLWIFPLVLYLLTYILVFDRRNWCKTPLDAKLALWFCVFWLALTVIRYEQTLLGGLLAYGGVVFFGCLFVHGMLARSRPHPTKLTLFYLILSTGGVLGGSAALILSPLFFKQAIEIDITILILVICSLIIIMKKHAPFPETALHTLAGILVIASIGWIWRLDSRDVIARYRNFYSILHVRKQDGNLSRYTLYNGRIQHGYQFTNPKVRRLPISYYIPESGVGLALKQVLKVPAKVGIVGLGAGTLSVYANAHDDWTYYEINPQVVEIANRYFSFLADSPTHEKIVLGDARLSLMRIEPQEFDLLVLDAFTGDAIPVHLLTLEAFKTYQRHLKKDGVLAVHISNRHVNLKPVVAAVAQKLGFHGRTVYVSPDKSDQVATSSDWVLLSKTPARLPTPTKKGIEKLATTKPILWTDDFNALLPVLK